MDPIQWSVLLLTENPHSATTPLHSSGRFVDLSTLPLLWPAARTALSALDAPGLTYVTPQTPEAWDTCGGCAEVLWPSI
jgi:hypothetical protein